MHFIGEDRGNADPTEFKRREIGRELEVSMTLYMNNQCVVDLYYKYEKNHFHNRDESLEEMIWQL